MMSHLPQKGGSKLSLPRGYDSSVQDQVNHLHWETAKNMNQAQVSSQ